MSNISITILRIGYIFDYYDEVNFFMFQDCAFLIRQTKPKSILKRGDTYYKMRKTKSMLKILTLQFS